MKSVFPDKSNKCKYLHRKFKRLELRSNKFNITVSSKQYKRNRWKTIQFPISVNLIKNPEETIKIFNQAYKLFHRGTNIEFNLSEVRTFSPESMAVFTACVADERFSNNQQAKGSLPDSLMVKELFNESGFFDHVSPVGNYNSRKKKSVNRLIHKIMDKKVCTTTARETCQEVMKYAKLEFPDDTEPVYDVLVEAMHNTNNHAGVETKGEYDWWLQIYEDKAHSLVHFTLLDIGVGIFESLPVKNFRRTFNKLFNTHSNAELVADLVDGKIKSRTNQPDRGRGVPQIYQCAKDNLFKNFYILSNDVLIEPKSNKHTQLKESFHGTMYYWTIEII